MPTCEPIERILKENEARGFPAIHCTANIGLGNNVHKVGVASFREEIRSGLNRSGNKFRERSRNAHPRQLGLPRWKSIHFSL